MQYTIVEIFSISCIRKLRHIKYRQFFQLAFIFITFEKDKNE